MLSVITLNVILLNVAAPNAERWMHHPFFPSFIPLFSILPHVAGTLPPSLSHGSTCSRMYSIICAFPTAWHFLSFSCYIGSQPNVQICIETTFCRFIHFFVHSWFQSWIQKTCRDKTRCQGNVFSSLSTSFVVSWCCDSLRRKNRWKQQLERFSTLHLFDFQLSVSRSNKVERKFAHFILL